MFDKKGNCDGFVMWEHGKETKMTTYDNGKQTGLLVNFGVDCDYDIPYITALLYKENKILALKKLSPGYSNMRKEGDQSLLDGLEIKIKGMIVKKGEAPAK